MPTDPKEKATWAKSEFTKEPYSQEDICKKLKKLNESKRSVQDKKAALMPFQQGQINKLMDELINSDHDTNFEWSLAQLDQKISTNRKGQKETSTITIYVKRAPLKDMNVIGLFNTIERNKQARLEQMNRPPPRPEPVVEHGLDPHAPIILNPAEMKKNVPVKPPGLPGRLNRMRKRLDDHSSVSSEFTESDEDSDVFYSSDGQTTISTSSGRRSRQHAHKTRSKSRPREHRKRYYVDERVLSPDPIHRNSQPHGAMPGYVPEVPPRVIPAVVPGFDQVAAAYRAGKIDADAERFGLERNPRRSIAEPTAIVSYGCPERGRIYSEARYVEEMRPRYVDDLRPRFGEEARPRYVDDLRYFDEREDEYLRRDERKRRDAEDYIDRHEPRYEPKVIYNPFTPMRTPRRYSYTPSHSIRDDYR
jgi:hypothetical protein